MRGGDPVGSGARFVWGKCPVGVTRARARACQRVVLTSTPWGACLDSASVREPGGRMIGTAGKHRAGAI